MDPGRGPTLVLERDHEIGLLRAAIEDLEHGRGRALKVRGPAGIGKSTVITEALRGHEDHPVVLIRAGVRPGPPLTVARSVAAGVLDAVGPGHVADVLTGAADRAWSALDAAEEEDVTLAIYGLTWLVTNAAGIGPLVLVAEDAHAADQPSRRLLEALAPVTEDAGLVLIVSERTGAAPTLAGFVDLDLDELTTATIQRLAVDALGPAVPPEAGVVLRERTGGNPLRVDRILRSVSARRPTGGATIDDLLDVEPSLRPPAEVGATDLAVVEATAVLGGSVASHLIGRLCATSAEVVEAAAERAGLLVIGDRVAFAHPLDETGAYQAITSERRRDLHLGAAHLLADLGAPADEVASHLSAAGSIRRGDGVDLLRASAHRARQGGMPERARDLLAAVDLDTLDAEDRYAVLIERGDVEAEAEATGAVSTFAAAAAMAPDPARRLNAQIRQARALFNAGAADEALDLIRGAADDAPTQLRLAAVVARCRLARFVLSERAQAIRELDQVLAAGWTIDQDDLDQKIMLAEIAFEHAATVDYGHEDVIRLASEALGDGQLLSAETADGLGWFWATYSLHLAGDNSSARSVADAAVADARRRGSIAGYVQALVLRSGPCFHLGDLTDGAADAELGIAAGRNIHRAFLPATRGALAQIRVWMGDLAGARDAIADQEAEGDGGTGSDMLHRYGRAVVALAHERPADALAELQAAGEAQDLGGGNNPAQIPWRSLAAEAMVLLGRSEEAVALAAAELELAERFGAPGPVGIARRAVALSGPPADRVELLRLAVVDHEHGERRVEHVQTLISLGEALHQEGKDGDARDPLREAMGLADTMGARLLVHVARQKLVAAGGRPRRTATRGIDAVTPAERRVLELACGDRTNREVAEELFITQKAVEWHLTSAYRKLGVNGRREAKKLVTPR